MWTAAAGQMEMPEMMRRSVADQKELAEKRRSDAGQKAMPEMRKRSGAASLKRLAGCGAALGASLLCQVADACASMAWLEGI